MGCLYGCAGCDGCTSCRGCQGCKNGCTGDCKGCKTTCNTQCKTTCKNFCNGGLKDILEVNTMSASGDTTSYVKMDVLEVDTITTPPSS